MQVHELVQAEVQQLSELYPEREWILSDWDSWHRNPCYTGPKGPHPEDDSAIDEISAFGYHVWQWRQQLSRQQLDDYLSEEIPF